MLLPGRTWPAPNGYRIFFEGLPAKCARAALGPFWFIARQRRFEFEGA
jgi:hypothetical protein